MNNNNTFDYQVPESSTVKCAFYFKSTPLRSWNVRDYAQHTSSFGSSHAQKLSICSEQFYNTIDLIRKNKDTPVEVKRLLNSDVFKVKV